MVHPLLSITYYEASVSTFTGKRRLMTVCKNARGVRYRLPCECGSGCRRCSVMFV
jgi:hypothetical protein